MALENAQAGATDASVKPTPVVVPVLWGNVVLAALLMLATLPGRSQGLGLINVELLKDLKIQEVPYAELNIWATILGAAFCLPIGRLLDWCGLRWVGVVLVGLFGVAIGWMSTFRGGGTELFVILLLVRGLGQSALSVASITVAGKSAGTKPGMAMGWFAVISTVLMGAAFVAVQMAVAKFGWRIAWGGVAGVLLIGIAPVLASFLREPAGAAAASPLQPVAAEPGAVGMTLGQTLRTRGFWVFCAAIALFSMASSGLGFWNMLVLAKQGYGGEMAAKFLAWTAGFGLLGQFGCGWLSKRRSLPRLLGGAMVLYGVGLGTLPFLDGQGALVFSSVLFGVSGGAVMVLFFAIWSAAFGRAHLGRIQGAAQVASVVASAVGPWIFAKTAAMFGTYAPLLFTLAPVVVISAVACWRVKVGEAEVVGNSKSLSR
jgi:MFS family permease